MKSEESVSLLVYLLFDSSLFPLFFLFPLSSSLFPLPFFLFPLPSFLFPLSSSLFPFSFFLPLSPWGCVRRSSAASLSLSFAFVSSSLFPLHSFLFTLSSSLFPLHSFLFTLHFPLPLLPLTNFYYQFILLFRFFA